MEAAITNGIHIKAILLYEGINANTPEPRYQFAYQVHITNEGARTVQLRRRRWHILEADGYRYEVDGEGVVGEQPILSPGQTYTYSSWCLLRTPIGQMLGHYLMEDAEDGRTFYARVPDFNFVAPFQLN